MLWTKLGDAGLPLRIPTRRSTLGLLVSAMIGTALLGATAAHASDVPAGGRTYVVQRGDTLWSISRRTGVSVDTLAQRNGIADPRRLRPGQRLAIDPPPAGPPPDPVNGVAATTLLVAAAHEYGLNPNLVLAVSYWESGWNQVVISVDGAVGMMQVMPLTAAWAGPALLGRQADVYRASDNARLGAALLRRYLDEFDDPKLALAAYYQGETGTREHGIYPTSQRYVDGIWALRNLFQAGRGAGG